MQDKPKHYETSVDAFKIDDEPQYEGHYADGVDSFKIADARQHYDKL